MKCSYCSDVINKPDWQIVEHIKECADKHPVIELSITLKVDGVEEFVTLMDTSHWTLKDKLDKWFEFVRTNRNLHN